MCQRREIVHMLPIPIKAERDRVFWIRSKTSDILRANPDRCNEMLHLHTLKSLQDTKAEPYQIATKGNILTVSRKGEIPAEDLLKWHHARQLIEIDIKSMFLAGKSLMALPVIRVLCSASFMVRHMTTMSQVRRSSLKSMKSLPRFSRRKGVPSLNE